MPRPGVDLVRCSIRAGIGQASRLAHAWSDQEREPAMPSLSDDRRLLRFAQYVRGRSFPGPDRQSTHRLQLQSRSVTGAHLQGAPG